MLFRSASASMPYVSKIVNYKGMKLLDGGCADSIPVEAFKRMGYDRIVVVPVSYTHLLSYSVLEILYVDEEVQ